MLCKGPTSPSASLKQPVFCPSLSPSPRVVESSRPPSLARVARDSRVSDTLLAGAPRDLLTKKQGCICCDITSKPNISRVQLMLVDPMRAQVRAGSVELEQKNFRFDAVNQPLQHNATTSFYSHTNQRRVWHALQPVCSQLQNSSQTHALPVWRNPEWVKRQRHQTAQWVIHKSHLASQGWRGRKVSQKTNITKAAYISQWPPDQVKNIYCKVQSESKGTKSKKTEKKSDFSSMCRN